MKLQPKPWNVGPKAGTRTYRQMEKAYGLTNSRIDIKRRIGKKVQKAVMRGEEDFQGRRQRAVARELFLWMAREAEDKIYGGP